MIKKLKILADFNNKKILYRDEVLEALYRIDDRFSFSKEDVELLKEKGHSLYISDQEEFKKDGCGDKFQWVSSFTFDGDRFDGNSVDEYFRDEATEQEMHYSKEHGFYVEVEDENN